MLRDFLFFRPLYNTSPSITFFYNGPVFSPNQRKKTRFTIFDLIKKCPLLIQQSHQKKKVLSPNTYRTRSHTRYYHFYIRRGGHKTLPTSTKLGLGPPLISLWRPACAVPGIVHCGSMQVSLKIPPSVLLLAHSCPNKVIAKPPWRTT